MKKDRRSPRKRAEALTARIEGLIAALEEAEQRHNRDIRSALPRHRSGARNLAQYLALRRQDIRDIQLTLASLGLSSLGRSEAHVGDTLHRLRAWLRGDYAAAVADAREGGLDWAVAERQLHENTHALLGPRPVDRHVYIMVTAPDVAEVTERWADDILKGGANVLRINGAHEGPAEWKRIADTFRARASARGRPCRIFVDLPGPKLRTEIRQYQDQVVHLPRRKDRLGKTVAPTVLTLASRPGDGAVLAVPAGWHARLQTGDVLELVDAGGRKRTLRVKRRSDGTVTAECARSLYLRSALPLVWRRGDETVAKGQSGVLPQEPCDYHLQVGDTFLLNGTGIARSSPCVLAFPEPALLAQVQPGERVLLDDGKLVGVAESAGPDGLLCRVQRVLRSPLRLRSGKGIAFPDSSLTLGQMGPQDAAALSFALKHADGIGASFVNTADDVRRIRSKLARAKRPGFGLILKLETRGAMENLPDILFEAMRYDAVGLMIARGDLAVELSFERLAEMQEEILWFGEACHLPVIWATQVLDTVARTGLPTRAEVTDAAMSMRAECVMLNKGPYVAAATRMLANIIGKMEAHQYKKRHLYRPLAVAQRRR